MSTQRSLPQTEWKPFFDRVSKALLGKRAEIEVASVDLGDQIIAEWVPLLGITYDRNDDLVDVALDRTDHMIRRPREIRVEEDAATIVSVAIVDEAGGRQIVRLKEPIPLPPAQTAPKAS